MPRQARLDAPGVLHHVIARGIEQTTIFRTDTDRQDFLARMAALCEAGAWLVYAWALLPTHFHLLARTAQGSLPASMRKLLTGYVVNFNRRHKRFGHLFQNRYKSILCEDEPYLLELTRYIHLNPLRAGMLSGLQELETYPWAGHSALLGTVSRPWQATDAILAYFGRRRRQAIARYEEFVAAGVPLGQRPELGGGGLIRSAGGWSQVLSMRRHGARMASDPRILGDSQFVEELLAQAKEEQRATLRVRTRVPHLNVLAARVATKAAVDLSAMLSGGRNRLVVSARRTLCHLAVKELGYTGAEVARFLGTTTSSVNRLAKEREMERPSGRK
jgi:REP element-mobilizing transposase RayT